MKKKGVRESRTDIGLGMAVRAEEGNSRWCLRGMTPLVTCGTHGIRSLISLSRLHHHQSNVLNRTTLVESVTATVGSLLGVGKLLGVVGLGHYWSRRKLKKKMEERKGMI